jgi:feruloyl esterase
MNFNSKLFLLSSFSLAAASVGNPAYAQACESLASLDIPDATITAAQSIPAGSFQPPTGAPITNLPAFCRVALTMAPSSDSSIRVEVWMPASTWTGRFQGTGGGGYTGSVNYGTLGNGLRLGNATANTDMGTAPASGGNGTALVGHPEKWLDFGSRSTHLMTVAGKILVQAFYGQPANYSYFTGCSTGGHQGLEEAQIFPDDYDGILAGAPGHNRTHLHMAFVNNFKVPHTSPGSVISASKLTMLNQAVLNACVGKDGGLATDPFLTDPRKCGFDPATLLCTAGDAPTCLTASEVREDGAVCRARRRLLFPAF